MEGAVHIEHEPQAWGSLWTFPMYFPYHQDYWKNEWYEKWWFLLFHHEGVGIFP